MFALKKSSYKDTKNVYFEQNLIPEFRICFNIENCTYNLTKFKVCGHIHAFVITYIAEQKINLQKHLSKIYIRIKKKKSPAGQSETSLRKLHQARSS